MGGIMKPKKRKDDTGLYMRQWNMELRETISRNMVAYEQKVKECKELKKQNNELKILCSKLEREHETVYQEWKAVIEEYKKLQNNRYKAIDKVQYIIDYGFDYDGFNSAESLKGLIDMLVDYARDTKKILKGDSDE